MKYIKELSDTLAKLIAYGAVPVSSLSDQIMSPAFFKYHTNNCKLASSYFQNNSNMQSSKVHVQFHKECWFCMTAVTVSSQAVTCDLGSFSGITGKPFYSITLTGSAALMKSYCVLWLLCSISITWIKKKNQFVSQDSQARTIRHPSKTKQTKTCISINFLNMYTQINKQMYMECNWFYDIMLVILIKSTQ